jgi:hypothetical protein
MPALMGIILAFAVALCSCESQDFHKKGTACKSYTDKKISVKKKSSVKRESRPANNSNVSAVSLKKKSASVTDDDLNIINYLRTARINGIKILSKRSMSLKLYLKDKKRAVFKPFLKGNRSARYEVAYYRLSKLLGIKNVPVSTMRTIPYAKIMGFLKKSSGYFAEQTSHKIKTDHKGMVKGAIIQWLNNLAPSNIDGANAVLNIKKILSQNFAGSPQLAENVSDMVVMDYIAGNWDRYTGGNLFIIKGSEELALIDNNNAFASWSARQEQRMNATLYASEKFSKKTIDAVKNLTPQKIKSAVTLPETISSCLLTESEIDRIIKRKEILLNYISTLNVKQGNRKIFFQDAAQF